MRHLSCLWSAIFCFVFFFPKRLTKTYLGERTSVKDFRDGCKAFVRLIILVLPFMEGHWRDQVSKVLLVIPKDKQMAWRHMLKMGWSRPALALFQEIKSPVKRMYLRVRSEGCCHCGLLEPGVRSATWVIRFSSSVMTSSGHTRELLFNQKKKKPNIHTHISRSLSLSISIYLYIDRHTHLSLYV